MPPPTVGRIVHYVSRGSADGVFGSVCRAALITDVGPGDVCSLAVLNPSGLFFDLSIPHQEPVDGSLAGGTWHWPERV